MLEPMCLFTLLYIRSFPQFLDGTAIATYIADSRERGQAGSDATANRPGNHARNQ